MEKQQGTFAVKAGLAQMLKGGVIMDVTNVEEARIAEEAGAVAVMALERVPADIRRCAAGTSSLLCPTVIRRLRVLARLSELCALRAARRVSHDTSTGCCSLQLRS